MARIKIDIPQQFNFSTIIPVRITDVNYGGHVGNDSILTLIHEARMQYLATFNYTELAFNGVGLIMSDVGIEFKSELHYGDELTAFVSSGEFSGVGFDLYYKLEKKPGTIVALAKTGMICFDYSQKKVVRIPSEAITKMKN